MRIVSRDRTILLTLLVAALFLRGAGVHLHYCYDGQEPRTSLHVADAGLHDGHETGPVEHRDIDAQLESGLLKSAKLGVDLPAISGTPALSPILLKVVRRTAAWVAPTTPYRWRSFLRPPLRAPPAPTP